MAPWPTSAPSLPARGLMHVDVDSSAHTAKFIHSPQYGAACWPPFGLRFCISTEDLLPGGGMQGTDPLDWTEAQGICSGDLRVPGTQSVA